MLSNNSLQVSAGCASLNSLYPARVVCRSPRHLNSDVRASLLQNRER